MWRGHCMHPTMMVAELRSTKAVWGMGGDPVSSTSTKKGGGGSVDVGYSV